MRILALSDIHGNVKDIPGLAKEAAKCDAIVLAGDITDFGPREQAQSVLTFLNKSGKPVLGVPGNCDATEVQEFLREQGVCLSCHPAEINGIRFVGLPYPASRESIKSITDYLAAHPPKPFVLVSHQPAGMTAVDLQGGTHHKGSQLIRSFIEDHQPLAAISGHIHEARGTDQLGDTLLINPGPFRNCCYATINLNGYTAKACLHTL